MKLSEVTYEDTIMERLPSGALNRMVYGEEQQEGIMIRRGISFLGVMVITALILMPALRGEAGSKDFEGSKGERYQDAIQISMAEAMKAQEEREKAFQEESLSYSKKSVRLLSEIKGLLEAIEENTRKEQE